MRTTVQLNSNFKDTEDNLYNCFACNQTAGQNYPLGSVQTWLPDTLMQVKVSLEVNIVSVNLHQHNSEVDLARVQNNFTIS